MRIDVLSVFPTMFGPIMDASMMGRAQAQGALEFHAHDLRDWTHDRHRTVDDSPYGGGQGMLMKCTPVFEALDDLVSADDPATVIFFTPTGVPFSQQLAVELASHERLVFVCGHYEGMDERVYSRASMAISLGDYVLTGGELPAMVVADAVVRLLPGVLGDDQSAKDESFSEGLLEYPQYTRPPVAEDLGVPEVLLSGNHARIDAWRRAMSIIRTCERRPELIASAPLSPAERAGALAYQKALLEDTDAWEVAVRHFPVLA